MQDSPLVLSEGRFARFDAIPWWEQSRLRQARVLVAGAGALGNEIIKNLALLGVGSVVIVDFDHIESSNLTRSVLFREGDMGQTKAHCAARAARELYPEIKTVARCANLLADIGLGYFRWADVVLGALDNREARVFLNAACARTGKVWFDGGIDVLEGVVRGFAPPETACYECTMGQVDWDLLNRRRSCSLLAQRALAEGGTPTTPTTASVIAALQTQEFVKYLHGMPALLGRGFVFDGRNHNSYLVEYPINPACDWHEPAAPIIAPDFASDTPVATVAAWAESELGGLDALDLAREIVRSLECPKCGSSTETWVPAERLTQDTVCCAHCGEERIPHYVHSLTHSDFEGLRTIGEAGLPLWDMVWARYGEQVLGIELAGDGPHALETDLPHPQEAPE